MNFQESLKVSLVGADIYDMTNQHTAPAPGIDADNVRPGSPLNPFDLTDSVIHFNAYVLTQGLAISDDLLPQSKESK